jgi:hypothetical protein
MPGSNLAPPAHAAEMAAKSGNIPKRKSGEISGALRGRLEQYENCIGISVVLPAPPPFTIMVEFGWDSRPSRVLLAIMFIE